MASSDLGLEVALGDGAGLEQELVGERALAVVDVGDDGEVADVRGRRRHFALSGPEDSDHSDLSSTRPPRIGRAALTSAAFPRR